MPTLSVRFDLVRVTLGAVVISVGPALYVFYSHLRLVATLVFAAGVLLTVTGLIALSFRRAIIWPRWSPDRIMRALRKAPETATVQILQTWFSEEDFVDQLLHLYLYEGKRFRLRVMLMNPGEQGIDGVLAARVKLGWIGFEDAARRIAYAQDGLARLKQQVDQNLVDRSPRGEDPPTVDVEVRFYDFMPFGPIFKIDDDVIFVGVYINYASSAFGPMIEIRRQRSPELWRVLERNLSEGWATSTCYDALKPAGEGGAAS